MFSDFSERIKKIFSKSQNTNKPVGENSLQNKQPQTNPAAVVEKKAKPAKIQAKTKPLKKAEIKPLEKKRADSDPAKKAKPLPKTSPKGKPVKGKLKKRPGNDHTKTGVKKLTGQEDLLALFSQEDQPSKTKKTPAHKKRPDNSGKGKTTRGFKTDDNGHKLNRNGIRVLQSDDEIHKLFEDEPVYSTPAPSEPTTPEPLPPEENFSEMLEESLSGKNRKWMMREKIDQAPPKRSPSAARLTKNLPAPEEELDLHGFTALKATEKTDLFIRGAFNRGLRTVRIIVGKGLHSEGPAVLPDVVEDRIIALLRDGKVLDYKWENKIKQKSGAVVVYLEYNPNGVYIYK